MIVDLVRPRGAARGESCVPSMARTLASAPNKPKLPKKKKKRPRRQRPRPASAMGRALKALGSVRFF